MTASEYVAALERCGWFEGLPDAARADVMAGANDAIEGDSDPSMNLGAALGDDEAEDPVKALESLSEASYGLLQVTAVQATDTQPGTKVSFASRSKTYSFDWPDSSEGWDNLIKLANRLVKAVSPQLRFLQISEDETGSIVLTNVKAFKNAQKEGLIPEMRGEGDDEE